MTNPTCEMDGGIAVVTLNGGKANTLTARRLAGLTAVLDAAIADGASAAVIRSDTDMFSAGLDLDWLSSLSAAELSEVPSALADALLAIFMSPILTVAAMPGHAIAGGAVLAMACDRRVATGEEQRLQMNEVAIGIPVPAWMEVIARTVLPEPHLSSIVQLAQPMNFGDAADLGVLELVADRSDLDRAALGIARNLAALEPVAFKATREMRHRAAVDAARRSL